MQILVSLSDSEYIGIPPIENENLLVVTVAGVGEVPTQDVLRSTLVGDEQEAIKQALIAKKYCKAIEDQKQPNKNRPF